LKRQRDELKRLRDHDCLACGLQEVMADVMIEVLTAGGEYFDSMNPPDVLDDDELDHLDHLRDALFREQWALAFAKYQEGCARVARQAHLREIRERLECEQVLVQQHQQRDGTANGSPG